MKKNVFLISLFPIIVTCLSSDFSKELEERLNEAHCDAQCLHKLKFPINCPVIVDCSPCQFHGYGNGSQVNVSGRTPLFSELQLVCKDTTVLSFEWVTKEALVFVLEIRTKDTSWSVSNKTMCTNTTLNNLQPDTEYQIRLWGVSVNGSVHGPVNSSWIKTFSKIHVPLPANNASLARLDISDGNYEATVNWTSAEDQACLYHIVITDEEIEDIIEQEVNAMYSPLEIELSNLTFETNYSIAIITQTLNMQSESNKTWFSFSTPSCLEAYQGNLTVCVPPQPQNLQSTEELVISDEDRDDFLYNVNLSWTQPERNPDYYTIYIIPSTENISMSFQNVSGNATSAYFREVSLGIFYRVLIRAHSPAGMSKATLIYKEMTMNVNVTSNHIPIVLGSLGGVLGLCLIGVILWYRKCRLMITQRPNKTIMSEYYESNNFKNKEKYVTSSNNISTEYYIPEIVNDEFYLNSDRVYVGELVGEGAFGVVHKGYLKKEDGKEVDVAIKMLKGNPNSDEIRQFEQEIEIMKSVGSHPHLVSMLGCCFKPESCAPCLVVEYCDKGDLQTYLRAVWHQMQSQVIEIRYINNPCSLADDLKAQNNFSNKIYELLDDTLLEPRDLLSFARQIALGMEYLSNLRVVHRDLAARNVLMSGNRTVKVADFGLSRDVYQDNVYLKTGAGKLPVKWMALESLSHQQYTTQSDVWSFGIVLWEIVTLGGNPYSAISAQDLLSLLKNGYRMERPKNCSEELYEIMKSCWKELAKDRPTFNELRRMLEKLLEDENRYVSLDVRF